MNWDKVKAAIGTVAPMLAATLGSPVAGIAVKALVDVFGLSGTATPDDLVGALAGASPEQLVALKEAENKHVEFMAKIGYDHVEQLEQDTVADRNSARLREAALAEANKADNTPKVLAALAVVTFIIFVAFVAIGQAPVESMRDGFWLLAGAVIATYKDVYGYYFGSSHGSQGKDATIKTMAGKENVP